MGKLLQGQVFILQRRYTESFKMALQALKESRELKDKAVEIGALTIKGLTFLYQRRLNSIPQIFEDGEKILECLSSEERESATE